MTQARGGEAGQSVTVAQCQISFTIAGFHAVAIQCGHRDAAIGARHAGQRGRIGGVLMEYLQFGGDAQIGRRPRLRAQSLFVALQNAAFEQRIARHDAAGGGQQVGGQAQVQVIAVRGARQDLSSQSLCFLDAPGGPGGLDAAHGRYVVAAGRHQLLEPAPVALGQRQRVIGPGGRRRAPRITGPHPLPRGVVAFFSEHPCQGEFGGRRIQFPVAVTGRIGIVGRGTVLAQQAAHSR